MRRLLAVTILSLSNTTAGAETIVDFGNMRLDRSQIQAAQQALTDLGYNPGPVDGALGNKTRNAFAEFAAARDYFNDGEFGENEVALLRAAQYNVVHLNDLTSMPLPDDWSIDMRGARVLEERERQSTVLKREYQSMGPNDMPTLWRENCVSVLSNIEEQVLLQWQAQKRNEEIPWANTIQGCLGGIGQVSSTFGMDDGFSALSEILDSISKDPYLQYISRTNETGLTTQFVYELNAVTTVIGAHYFVYYDEYNLDHEQRERIDDFLTRALQYDVDNYRNPNFTNSSHPLCRRENIDLVGFNPNRKHNGRMVTLPDACNSMRWKLAVAQILGGLRFNNEILWELGKFNTDVKLNLFDQNNIDVPWATMSGHAIDYSSNVLEFLGFLTEIFYSADFDLLEHRNENGASVAEIQKTYWEFQNSTQLFKDSPFFEYALRDLRDDRPVSDIENETLKDLFWINGRNAYMYATWVHRYADRYEASILQYTERSYLSRVHQGPHLMLPTSDTFRIVDPELLYLANADRDNLAAAN